MVPSPRKRWTHKIWLVHTPLAEPLEQNRLLRPGSTRRAPRFFKELASASLQQIGGLLQHTIQIAVTHDFSSESALKLSRKPDPSSSLAAAIWAARLSVVGRWSCIKAPTLMECVEILLSSRTASPSIV
mmetsp:Transcript_113811/g.179807  ORF Transcript_113811/g.179807 Transcript_113811/m.179807 type:complete len:129 (+) Transcript_113811:67-453(+)